MGCEVAGGRRDGGERERETAEEGAGKQEGNKITASFKPDVQPCAEKQLRFDERKSSDPTNQRVGVGSRIVTD